MTLSGCRVVVWFWEQQRRSWILLRWWRVRVLIGGIWKSAWPIGGGMELCSECSVVLRYFHNNFGFCAMEASIGMKFFKIVFLFCFMQHVWCNDDFRHTAIVWLKSSSFASKYLPCWLLYDRTLFGCLPIATTWPVSDFVCVLILSRIACGFDS